MHIRSGGYVGVAPLPGAIANICVVREATAAQTSPDQVIAGAITADPLLRDRCAEASRITDVLVLGPLAVESRGAGCHGLLLAGDAAGFVDPMTGDVAVRSARGLARRRRGLSRARVGSAVRSRAARPRPRDSPAVAYLSRLGRSSARRADWTRARLARCWSAPLNTCCRARRRALAVARSYGRLITALAVIIAFMRGELALSLRNERILIARVRRTPDPFTDCLGFPGLCPMAVEEPSSISGQRGAPGPDHRRSSG